MTGFLGLHVGAGQHSESLRRDYLKLCNKACLDGTMVLKAGGSALEAATSATTVLENSNLTNAGFGSNLTWNGRVECDASVMDGHTLQYGAVGAVPGVKNPVLLARYLCEMQSGTKLALGRVPPCLLVGNGARKWAKLAGIPTVPPKELISEKALKLHHHYKRKLLKYGTETNKVVSPLDTVGVVCMDKSGNVAAASSSGGVVLKHPGRVGQAAVYGCGCWAQNCEDNLPSTASCTSGCGEYLMRTILAKEVCLGVQSSNCSVTGLHNAMTHKFIESPFLNGVSERLGGAVVLKWIPKEEYGEFLWTHSTKTMCVGYMSTCDSKPKAQLSRLPDITSIGRSVLVEGITFRNSLPRDGESTS